MGVCHSHNVLRIGMLIGTATKKVKGVAIKKIATTGR